jgi:hypothetical protein
MLVEWEIRASATAANANGGGCIVANTTNSGAYVLQDAAQYNLVGCTSSGAGNVVLTASAAADMVGYICHVISGTNFTAGFFEITSVTPGVSFTCSTNQASASITTGVGASGVINIGGAFSLNTASDNAIFQLGAASNGVGAHKFWIRGASGAVTVAQTISSLTAGGTLNPISVIGYNTTRGDNPTGSTRPVITNTGGSPTFASNWNFSYIVWFSSGTTAFTGGASFVLIYSKIVNNSAVAGRTGLVAGSNCLAIACEIICYRGTALTGGSGVFIGCRIHSSNIGINGAYTLINCIIEGCVTTGITLVGVCTLDNCTVSGWSTPLGTGLSMAVGAVNCRFVNSIVWGWTTGATHGSSGETIVLSDFNDYFNNTTPTANITTGHNDLAVDPQFTNAITRYYTLATTSNTGNTFVLAGANFTGDGIVAGRDYLYISSTSGTAGIYGILSVDSATQLTLDLAPGASSNNVSAQIIVGHDYSVGTNLKATAFPGVMPGGLTTGYLDTGAIQRQEPTSSGGMILARVRTGF